MTISDLELKLCDRMLDESDRIFDRGFEHQRDMNLIQLKMLYELCGEDLPEEAKKVLDDVFFQSVSEPDYPEDSDTDDSEKTSSDQNSNEDQPIRTF